LPARPSPSALPPSNPLRHAAWASRGSPGLLDRLKSCGDLALANASKRSDCREDLACRAVAQSHTGTKDSSLDGTVTHPGELAWQRWEGQRIAEETFSYDPAQPVPQRIP
jgi:hypothetical protein